ncbi:hypothetical protein CSKR_107464 [Clonorchis sinensis]|uniref:Uncharacterized protein n=1 Tax=Clonorchis sinensis TaxID=79923 RepID=A0A419PYF0_CLOSI|nr:hypothetical protein CSKR_107464 [Clonorchis sinensis]
MSKTWFLVFLTLCITLSPTGRCSLKTGEMTCPEKCRYTAANCETNCGPQYPVMDSECVAGCRIGGLFCEDACQLNGGS